MPRNKLSGWIRREREAHYFWSAMSTFGTAFRTTTYGESHCRSVGCIVDGCPPGMKLSEADIQRHLNRRRPGQSNLTTPVTFAIYNCQER